MKLTSYKKTGYYYIDDEAEDETGNLCAEKVYEYFFYFDDGTAFVYYLPESLIADFEFSESNKSLSDKYIRARAEHKTGIDIPDESHYLRCWLSREFGIENNNFPKQKVGPASYTICRETEEGTEKGTK